MTECIGTLITPMTLLVANVSFFPFTEENRCSVTEDSELQSSFAIWQTIPKTSNLKLPWFIISDYLTGWQLGSSFVGLDGNHSCSCKHFMIHLETESLNGLIQMSGSWYWLPFREMRFFSMYYLILDGVSMVVSIFQESESRSQRLL